MMFLALPASGQGLILQARPVGNPAGGAGVSNEKAGLHIPRGRRVNFNTYLNDGAGFRWDIQYHLNIGQGMNHAYSGGLYCQIKVTVTDDVAQHVVKESDTSGDVADA